MSETDESVRTFKLTVEVKSTDVHPKMSNASIARVADSDLDNYSEDDWLVLNGDKIVNHFKNDEHIDLVYMQAWCDGYLSSILD